MAFAQIFSCKCSLVVINRKVWLICQPQAYRCSASPCPHAVLAVHLFLLFNRFKHEWSACRFWSLRQTSMFVFICATSRAKQRIVSSPLVPILRSCVRKCSHVKRISQKSVKHQYSIKCWTDLSDKSQRNACTHLLYHSGRSSWFPVHCLHYQDRPHWQNSHPLQRKKSASMKT